MRMKIKGLDGIAKQDKVISALRFNPASFFLLSGVILLLLTERTGPICSPNSQKVDFVLCLLVA